MRELFLWFYRLDLSAALILVALATGGFCWLRTRFQTASWWRTALWAGFLAWVGVILLGTLGQRTGSQVAPPEWTLFHSYRAAVEGDIELYRANFMNLVLFYPAGLLGAGVLPPKWPRWIKALAVTVVFCLMSGCIEWLQLRFSLGRMEVDDVFHNTLGTALGALILTITTPKYKN